MDWREEDLFLAQLPDGDYLDVGWYPACDPGGCFRVALRHSIDGSPVDIIRVVEPARIAGAAEVVAFAGPARRAGIPGDAGSIGGRIARWEG